MNGLGYSRRGPLAAVKDLFPNIIISEGITEEDDLWAKTGGNESEAEAGERVESAFKDVWDMAKDNECECLFLAIDTNLIIRYSHCLS